MVEPSTGQVQQSAAEIYDAYFLPALFLEWAPRVADAVELSRGDRVLDVACGTGALTCEAHRRVQPDGLVTGLDCNEAMLAVAKRKSSAIDWQLGRAEALPFPDQSFDAVVSQFGLMFFADRRAALQEMWRVLKPERRAVVAVWDIIEHSPGYAAMANLLQRLFGDRIASELRAPFALGDLQVLNNLLAEAGFKNAGIQTIDGTARFPSLYSWIETDVKGWTFANMIDDAQYQALLRAAETGLNAFAGPAGKIEFRISAHVATAVKR